MRSGVPRKVVLVKANTFIIFNIKIPAKVPLIIEGTGGFLCFPVGIIEPDWCRIILSSHIYRAGINQFTIDNDSGDGHDLVLLDGPEMLDRIEVSDAHVREVVGLTIPPSLPPVAPV